MTDDEIRQQNINAAYREMQSVVDDLRAALVQRDVILDKVIVMLGTGLPKVR